MSIKWISPAAGVNIATIPENNFFQQQLIAEVSGANPLFYRFLSGELPLGMQITGDGLLQGVPVRPPNADKDNYTYSFAVRASLPSGEVADRTFSVTVSIITPPLLLPPSPEPPKYRLNEIFDGIPYYLKLTTIDSPITSLEYSISRGSLPLGLTLSKDGVISGIPLIAESGTYSPPGYDLQYYDILRYDFQLQFPSRIYDFDVRVFDGVNSAINRYSIRVVKKGQFTADNNEEDASNDFLNISYDNSYLPQMLTPAGNIGRVRQLDNFAFKFEAIDPELFTINYEISLKILTPFDENNFDIGEFDQDSQGIPNSLTFNPETGWLYGLAPSQVTATQEYFFKITPFRKDFPNLRGPTVSYSLTVLGSLYNTITWITDSDLGVISEGKPCTIEIQAVASNNKRVVYSLETGVLQLLPQGVKLTTDGYLIGRPTFRRFSVDNDYTIVYVADNTGIDIGMSVTGPAVGTGAEVVSLPDTNSIVVKPAVIASSGTALTFFNNTKSVTLITTQPNSTTTITDRENGIDQTTFDQVRQFTVRATTIDSFISDTKTFTIKLTNYHLAPYENLYLRALPKLEQRLSVLNLLEDPSIFPEDLIYRKNDPYFGKAKDIKVLLLPGIAPSSLSAYAGAMIRNHYNKKIKFGSIKTARAVNEFFETAYEVVYVEIIDMQIDQGRSISREVIDLEAEYNHFNPYLINGQEKTVIYPNSLNNMRNKISGTLGFENRGALPDWMTSPQLDGRVIGFVPCVILTYTVPNGSDIIKYRLEKSGFNFNNIDFTADRYQLDNILSQYYDTSINKFIASTETTFDYIPAAGYVDANVDYSSIKAFSEIDNRTLDYVISNGGIDGVTDLKSGDTLIFSKQEFPELPYDGWVKYLNEFGDAFDSEAIDSLEIIPGYLNKIKEIQQTGTYSQVGNEVTVTLQNHRYKVGFYINVGIASGLSGQPITARNGTYVITQIVNSQTFKYIAENSTTTSGICTVSSLGSRDGTYIQNRQTITVTLADHNLQPGFLINIIQNGQDSRNVAVQEVLSTSTFTFRALTDESSAGSITVTIINQRSGIWRLDIDANNIVTLTWRQEILIGEKVRINQGSQYGNTIAVYDPQLKPNETVPSFTILVSENNPSSTRTTFDGNGTKIIDYRDIYVIPESGDKYLKFPQIGVFN